MGATAWEAGFIRKYRPERAVMEQSRISEGDIALAQGSLWRPAGDNCWRAILCQEGAIWITQEGDPRDHVISAGEMFLISQRGEMVVQALVDARMQLTPSLASAPFSGRFEDTVWP
jgi:hypothetical protein